jgi:hypothetical protein
LLLRRLAAPREFPLDQSFFEPSLRWLRKHLMKRLLFTLLLLGVLLILRARSLGQASACASNLKNISTACEMYSTDHAGQYPTTLQDLIPNYLRTIPTCPAAGVDTYSANFWIHEGRYAVCCTGTFHRSAGELANHPAFESTVCTLAAPSDDKPLRPDLALCCVRLRAAGLAVEAYYRKHSRLPRVDPCDLDQETTLSRFGVDEFGCPFFYRPGKSGHFLLCSSQRVDYLDQGIAPEQPSYESGRGLSLLTLKPTSTRPRSDAARTLLAVIVCAAVLQCVTLARRHF